MDTSNSDIFHAVTHYTGGFCDFRFYRYLVNNIMNYLDLGQITKFS